MAFLALALCATATPAPVAAPHIPHAVVRDIALAPTQGGGSELVVCMNEETRVLHSYDEGLTWYPLSGEGLDRREPTRVEYWPHPSDPRFVIATDGGVWFYRPATGEVFAASNGLPADDLFVTELSAAANGLGPVVLSTKRGRLYGWDDTAGAWQLLLNTQLDDELGRIAIAPEFDPLAPPGRDRTILATVRGLLLQSTDGGATWGIHPQFTTPTYGLGDFAILSIAFASDFRTSGQVVLGRARASTLTPTGQEGEIWRSGDGGASYALALAIPAGIAWLYGAPAGPSGVPSFHAATVTYPDRLVPETWYGLLRSDDGGVTWDDRGNFQDFFLRKPDWSVSGVWYFFGSFAVAPDYAQSGEIYFGRSTSMFRSNDSGVHWRAVRTRQTDFLRALGVGRAPNGDILAYGSSYGSGLLRVNLTAGSGEHIIDNILSYQRDVAVSPNFESDGMVLIGGASGNAMWFDPAVPTNNQFGVSGWFQGAVGGTREVAISPHFHAQAGVPGADMSLVSAAQDYLTLDSRIYLTLDGGLTIQEVNRDTNGARMPPLSCFGFARTWDDQSPSGRTDLYAGAHNGGLYRLEDTRWRLLQLFDDHIAAIQADPDFARPGNPRLFLAFHDQPELLEVIDDPGGLVMIPHDYPGFEGALVSIALHPDFGNQPVVYGGVWGEGVFKLDLAQPAPAWVAVGGAYPDLWTTEVLLSPSFPQDGIVIASTERGIVTGVDQPGVPWTLVGSDLYSDDIDLGWTYYEPNHPSNPQPDRPYPWGNIDAKDVLKGYSLHVFGQVVRLASSDGAWLDWEGYGRRFEFLSFASPLSGTLTFEAYDYWTGALLASTTQDLHMGGGLFPATLALDLPQRQAVRLRVTGQLDPGEVFPFDGMRIVD